METDPCMRLIMAMSRGKWRMRRPTTWNRVIAEAASRSPQQAPPQHSGALRRLRINSLSAFYQKESVARPIAREAPSRVCPPGSRIGACATTTTGRDLVRTLAGEVLPADPSDASCASPGARSGKARRPASWLSTPFNFPLNLVLHKVIPAGGGRLRNNRLRLAPQAPLRPSFGCAEPLLEAGWPPALPPRRCRTLLAREARAQPSSFRIFSLRGVPPSDGTFRPPAARKKSS